jgi:hypothetical protein
MVVLFAVTLREVTRGAYQRVGITLIAVLGIGAIAVTHHLSSYFLALSLLVWALVRWRIHPLVGKAEAFIRWVAKALTDRLRLRTAARYLVLLVDTPTVRNVPEQDAGTNHRQGPGDLALIAGLAALSWLVFVGYMTIGYLRPVLGGAIVSVIRMISREESARQLFESTGGYVPPLWERIMGIGSVLLLLLVLPFGLVQIIRRYRDNSLALVLSGAAVLYFAMLGMRFTSEGWETANRASAFLYIGLSLVVALGIIEICTRFRASRIVYLLFAVYLAVVFMGGLISGWPPKLRLTQPYLVAGYPDTIEPEGVSAARWARSFLGPGNRMATDETNARLMLIYGDQFTLTSRKGGVRALIFSDQIGRGEQYILQVAHTPYVVLDRRLVSWDNMRGLYFERQHRDTTSDREFIDPSASEKFDRHEDVSRIFDSGNLTIYDVGAFIENPSVE